MPAAARRRRWRRVAPWRRAWVRARLGRRAERAAERLLRRRGLRTVARNYACRQGEVDLVMLDDEVLVVVEVRFRGRGAWVGAVESVDRGKRRRIEATAAHFVAAHAEHRHRGIRFDVVAAAARNYRIACEWIPNAFDAMDC